MYGHYGNVKYGGETSWYANSSGYGQQSSGTYHNEATGTTGSYNASRGYDAGSDSQFAKTNRSYDTAAGGSGDAQHKVSYDYDNGKYSYKGSESGTTASGSDYSHTHERRDWPRRDLEHLGHEQQDRADLHARARVTAETTCTRVRTATPISSSGSGWQSAGANGWQNASGNNCLGGQRAAGAQPGAIGLRRRSGRAAAAAVVGATTTAAEGAVASAIASAKAAADFTVAGLAVRRRWIPRRPSVTWRAREGGLDR